MFHVTEASPGPGVLSGIHPVEVGADHGGGITNQLHLAALEPDRPVAHRFDHRHAVADDDHGGAALAQLVEVLEALALEGLVADGDHLVDQQHFGVDVDRHGKTEAHVHAGAVHPHGGIDELADLGEIDDAVHAGVHLGPG